jgi:hypothetical protein
MNRVKGNVTFKSPARMRGNSRIGGEPDGKGVMVDQRADPGQHIRKQKHHGNELLCCPAPERQYVPGVSQGHNHAIFMNRQILERIPAIAGNPIFRQDRVWRRPLVVCHGRQTAPSTTGRRAPVTRGRFAG